MTEALLRLAFGYRALVVTLVIAIAGLGVVFALKSKVEAYPDISGVSVTVITTYPGRAPEEVERQITIPTEAVLASVPRVETIRSRTIFGLSVVQLSFEEDTEGYWARQRVQEKLNDLKLPKEASNSLAPYISSAGEICRYEVRSDGTQSVMDLRTLHDWVIIPRLMRASGVGDVANFGGDSRQFTVYLLPSQLQRFGLTFAEVVDAVKANNSTAGGSVVTRGSMSFVVRGRGALQDEAEIGRIFVKSVGGTPIYLGQVARITTEPKLPTGIFGKDTNPHTIEGLVTMRKGENASVVLGGVKEAIEELNRTLPTGVEIKLFYDRAVLVNNTIETVVHSVVVGIGLVVLVLLFFLGSPRLALLVSLTIPFSLLFALALMYCCGIPIGLLSIGAIDFGIIVDGAVIVVDHIAHRLGQVMPGAPKQTVRAAILEATLEVQRPVFFSVLTIIGVHIPLLTLVRIEGLLFRPMAITIVFALVGCLLFALLAVPVLASLLLPNGYREWENPLLRIGRPLYAKAVGGLVRWRWVAGPIVFGVLGVAAAWLLPRLGSEFLPFMDEGVIWVRANFPEGTSLEKTASFADEIRAILAEYRDIDFVTSRAGRADNGLDPFPPSRVEMMVGPKPMSQWREFHSKAEMIQSLRARLKREFPSTRFNFTQPIIDNVTEEVNGTSANLAIEFSGNDSALLQDLAKQSVKLLRDVPGAVDVAIEQEGPQPQLVIDPDRQLCARYNVRIEDVNTLINTALGGDPIATLYEGDRVFDIVAKFDRSLVNSLQGVKRLPVFTTEGVAIPLEQIAKIDVQDGQTLIAREGNRRRITVRCDISGRDQGGFVAEAQRRFAKTIKVPSQVKVSWIGMFQNLERARNHFAIVGPITVVLIAGLLVITLGSIRAALAVLVTLPFAFLGGALAIWARGMNVNVSVGVGFAALFGVSIMNGVLMVQRITSLRQAGLALDDAIRQGSCDLLRPIVMASLVAMLGLLPASLATGLGSDVQRPLATVIVWGLFMSTAMTLFVVPISYRIFAPPAPELDPRERKAAVH